MAELWCGCFLNMYIPTAFHIQDLAKLHHFIEQNSFATVITQVNGVPFASHLPLLLETEAGPNGQLVGHLARANPQWQHFASGQEALVIFHGPHAYISPRWYEVPVAVPTWNYAVVHAYGIPEVITDETQLESIVNRTVRFYEGDGPDAWRGDLPAEYVGKMLKAIVGFQIPIARLEGKFKLGQNRSATDVAGVYNALNQSSSASDRALAEFMREQGLPPASIE